MASNAATQKINWPEEWTECAGERTIAMRSKEVLPVKLYTSWFCPFAQRAWIAMEEKKVAYQWIEINPYEVDPKEPGGYTKKALPLAEKGKRHPGFLEASPTGLIPGLDNGGEKVHDSLVVVEYIEEAFEGPSFMPESPLQRARVRYWSGFVTDKIQKHYYTMLISQDKKMQEEYKQKFYDACRDFAREMADPKQCGPYFLGKNFTMVDIAFAPFWQRILWVGGHYRGLTFPDEPEFERLRVWWEAVSERKSVADTLVCKPRLLSSYKQYALNQATSDYGKMIQGIMRRSGGGQGGAESSPGVSMITAAGLCAVSAVAAAFVVVRWGLFTGQATSK